MLWTRDSTGSGRGTRRMMSGHAAAQKASLEHAARHSYYPHFDFKAEPSRRPANEGASMKAPFKPGPKQSAARRRVSAEELSEDSFRKREPPTRPSLDVAAPPGKQARETEETILHSEANGRSSSAPDKFYETEKSSEIDETNAPLAEPQSPERDRGHLRTRDVEAQDSLQERYALARAATYKPSEEIYVLGTDIRGRFFAHAISSCKTLPPVRVLMHNRSLWRQWEESGRRIDLHRGDETLSQSRIIGEYSSTTHRAPPGANVSGDERIDNLVVTLPAHAVVRAFKHIRHRIDQWSTVCLVQDGLGVVEELVEAYFPDPLQRPLFLLGHMSHRLGHAGQRNERKFSLAQIKPGRIYLTIYNPDAPSDPRGARSVTIKRHPPVELTIRGTHLLRLLSATPELQASAAPWDDWLRHKLPAMVFHAIADTLSTVLDMPLDQIPGNGYAMQLVDHMLGEICHAITRLPETKDWKKFARFQQASVMRSWVVGGLTRRQFLSDMHRKTTHGWESDVDYLLGYFVKRAREVGIHCHSLSTVLWLAKAKHADNLRQRRLEVPFEWYVEAEAKKDQLRATADTSLLR